MIWFITENGDLINLEKVATINKAHIYLRDDMFVGITEKDYENLKHILTRKGFIYDA